MNAGSCQGKCRTQHPFQKWQGQWTGKNCGEPGLIKKDELESPSHRLRSESIWGTSLPFWKEELPNSCPAGSQLCYGPVITLCPLFLFRNKKCDHCHHHSKGGGREVTLLFCSQAAGPRGITTTSHGETHSLPRDPEIWAEQSNWAWECSHERGHVLYMLKEKWNGFLVNRGVDCGRDNLMCLLNPFHFPSHYKLFFPPFPAARWDYVIEF